MSRMRTREGYLSLYDVEYHMNSYHTGIEKALSINLLSVCLLVSIFIFSYLDQLFLVLCQSLGQGRDRCALQINRDCRLSASSMKRSRSCRRGACRDGSGSGGIFCGFLRRRSGRLVTIVAAVGQGSSVDFF